MAAFSGAALMAKTGREPYDVTAASDLVAVPDEADAETAGPPKLLLLIASHVSSADRLCALGDALRASSVAQTRPPDGLLVSWSAEPAWRDGARALVEECREQSRAGAEGCSFEAAECVERHSQFEHFAALAHLAAHRYGGRARDTWAFFADDDDVAHPVRRPFLCSSGNASLL